MAGRLAAGQTSWMDEQRVGRAGGQEGGCERGLIWRSRMGGRRTNNISVTRAGEGHSVVVPV